MSKKDPAAIHLSVRETEILNLVIIGLTSKDIGERLFMSKRTVDAYRRKLLKKTGSKNSVVLTAWAFRHGLVR